MKNLFKNLFRKKETGVPTMENIPAPPERKSYHNTTKESGSTLIEYKQKAGKQDEDILKEFKMLKTASPSTIFFNMSLINESILLTSVRRSITNLTTAGKLEKTDSKQMGIYGRKEYLWTIKTV